jgi:hypothetical protein
MLLTFGKIMKKCRIITNMNLYWYSHKIKRFEWIWTLLTCYLVKNELHLYMKVEWKAKFKLANL